MDMRRTITAATMRLIIRIIRMAMPLHTTEFLIIIRGTLLA